MTLQILLFSLSCFPNKTILIIKMKICIMTICLDIQSNSNIIIHKSLNYENSNFLDGSKPFVETFLDEKTLSQLVT